MNYLDKFFPKTEIFATVENEINKVEGADRAFKAWKTLLTVKRANDTSFLLIGCILKKIRDEKLYLTLDYESFSQFLSSEELGFSREKAYMCIKTYEYYIEYLELNPESVRNMNVSRLSMMVPVLKQIEDKTEAVKQVEQLNSLRHNDFVREVKNRTNKAGKPNVYWSQQFEKWIVEYHPDTTLLQTLDNFNQ